MSDLPALRWDEGEPIIGSPFRHLIRAAQTEGRFSAQSAVLTPRTLIVPHTHTREDEFTFVYEGVIGVRLGDRDMTVEAGSVAFKPRRVLHALWNPTDEPAVIIQVISPAGFEGFFEEVGEVTLLSSAIAQSDIDEIARRYGEVVHPELVPELSRRYGVHP